MADNTFPNEITQLLKDYIQNSYKERREVKESIKELYNEQKTTNKCITNIKLQVERLNTYQEFNTKHCEERIKDCDTKHKQFEDSIKNIPSKEKMKNISDIVPTVYKMMGGLIVVVFFISVLSPYISKLIFKG